FYCDEFVVAFPTPAEGARLTDADEKALYFREPYSSKKGVKPFLPMPAEFAALPAAQCIATNGLLDLTAKRASDGRLTWDVPAGNWTILRFGRTTTGQTTRPAPQPGLGLESDKFSRAALDAHYAAFIGELLKEVGPRKKTDAGLTMIHFDSWEMSSQNWSENFRAEFRQRRGYDPLPFLPALLGRVVQSAEISERFLWDLRQVAQELVVTNHAVRLKELGAQSNLRLSIEPYDLNPTSDLELGGVADVPMCEFWSKGFGFPAEFSCFEASSIAHTLGRSVVGAEAFTSMPGEDWRQYPGAMKDQTDWALCCGINRFTIHRYQHQPWLDRWPGMTMGAHGVYWERTQTWWDMVPAYHAYLSRCQALLRRGAPVSDILYLAGEGAPHVFRPPASALLPGLPDRRGYNFDGCAPSTLLLATVHDGRIVLPGASYRVLVLPRFATMTPALLGKIKTLVAAGATVVGAPPQKSPSLQNFPQCDAEVQKLAAEIWSDANREHVIRDELPPAVAPVVASASQLPKARWIWHEATMSAPPCVRSFRREVVLPATRIASATVQMTADNSFALFVNGSAAGTGNNFHDVIEINVAAFLKTGTNVITVTVENTGDAPNPAGMLGVLAMKFSDGAELVVPTDKSWNSAEELCGPWRAAHDLGPMKMMPWKISPPKPSAKPLEIYPDYAGTASLLARLGVAPDFEATGDVRYIHRREAGAEIYFVGNRSAQPLATECRFRVTGKQPELWNPLTGERRALTNFCEHDGRTSVPLEFAPQQSCFVIFRNRARVGGPDDAKNFHELTAIEETAGPWQVSFDPKGGGPESVVFEKLDDWSKRPEEGIRYYSGVATYRTSFQLPSLDTRQSTLCLDLGAVHAIATVRLNGKEIGTVWTQPYEI
ncbi:MAG: glycosyl hydrolase, partial [Kiritimatiellaeota bacterium]|nr:glycosyl hydrolase [Kiritimatiellota bacterium]